MTKIPQIPKLSKEIKIWIASIIIGTFLTAIITMTQAYAVNVQSEIAQNVIRFHVIANSDSAQDQALKNFVRDEVLYHFGGNLDRTASINETRLFIMDNLTEIERFVIELIDERYPVKAVLGNTVFPTRTYGHMSFPAGEYEALRIIIGEGRGSNWWCVMFPPLCYVDAATPQPISSDDYTVFSKLLSTDTYAVLNHSQNNTGVTVRFKVVEWWQEFIHSNDSDPQPDLWVYHFGDN